MVQEPDASSLLELWNRCQQGRPESHQGLSARLIEEEGRKIGLVTMPAPSKSPEAYFVALVFEPQPYRYLVLEKSFPGTVLGQWNPRANLGEGPPPEAEAFLAAVRDAVSNPEELTYVTFDLTQLNLQAGELATYIAASEKNLLTVAPERLASFHCFFLLASCKGWQPYVCRAVGASWWSFRFKRKVRDYFAWHVMMLLNHVVYQVDPVASVRFTMASQLVCKYAFPRGSQCWNNYPEVMSPESLAEALARALERPARAAAIHEVLLPHAKIIEEKMRGINLLLEIG